MFVQCPIRNNWFAVYLQSISCTLYIRRVMNSIKNIRARVVSARRLVLLLVALFLAVAAPLLSESSASAAPDHSCAPHPQVCFFEHANFGGSSWSVGYPSPWTCYNAGAFINDKASSVVNYTLYTIRYFKDANCNLSACYPSDGVQSYRAKLLIDTYTGGSWPSGVSCMGYSPENAFSSFMIYP